MTRAFRYRNYGVYVSDERNERHNLPHAHIRERGTPICTVNLFTLEPLQEGKQLPTGLFAELKERQEELLALWEELNDECP